MGELIAHLFGDYIIQNHFLARRKTASSFVAMIHAGTYTLPFLCLTQSPAALAIISVTHFFIDRFALAKLWTGFWGVGEPGWCWEQIRIHHAKKCAGYVRASYGHDRPDKNHPWDDDWIRLGNEAYDQYLAKYPLIEASPIWLTAWLGIIVDNTFHLLINHLALRL